MSNPQHRTSLQCPNCGGTMMVGYIGNLQDKQVICQYCHTAFDVPDNFERVRKVRREQKGLFRRREVVEEEIVERRSDFAPASPPQPQFQQQQGQPIVIHVPGFDLGPGMRQGQQSSGGSCIGSLIVLSVIGCIVLSIGATVLPFIGLFDASDLPFGLDKIAADLGIENIEEREPIRSIGGHEWNIENVAFSPDNTRFITVDGDSVLRLWDADTYALIEEVDNDLAGVTTLQFIGDGSTFVTASSSGYIRQWSTATGEPSLYLPDNRFHFATFRADGTQYAAVTYDNYGLAIRNFPSNTTLVNVQQIGDWIQGGLYSPSGDYLVLMGGVGELYIFETNSWRQIYQDESGATSSDGLAFIPDTDTLVVADNSTFEFYEIVNSTVSSPDVWEIDKDFLSIDSLAISPDRRYAATGNFFDDVYVWDLKERKQVGLLTCDCSPKALAFSSDGTRLIGGGGINNSVYIWDVEGLGD